MAGVTWSPVRGHAGVYSRTDERGRKRYRVVWWGPNPITSKRKQYARTFDRQKDATDWKSDNSGSTPPPPPPKTKKSLKALYDEMVADAASRGEEYAQATLDLHGWVWKYVPKAIREVRPVASIQKAEIDTLLKKIEAPQMRDKTRRVLSAVFNYGLSLHPPAVTANPATAPRKTRTRKARISSDAAKATAKKRFLSDDELRRLLDALPDRYPALVETMARVGLRPGEALALTVGKLDPMRRTLLINTSVTGFTKTGEPRTITIPAVVAELLRDHIEKVVKTSEWAELPGEWTKPDALVFPAADGHMLTVAGFRSIFHRAAKKASVNDGVNPNDCRHTAASFAIAHGGDVYAIQKMLGHANAAITLNIYGELWDGSQEKLADTLDGAIRAARKPARAANVAAIR